MCLDEDFMLGKFLQMTILYVVWGAVWSFGQVKQITPVYETQYRDETSTLDSPAIWVAPDPLNSILYTTAKKSGNLEKDAPSTGSYLGTLGTPGSGPGELDRPNGVAVAYDFVLGNEKIDLLIVVERDNHRFSVFKLPGEQFLGYFAENVLDRPYGVAVNWYENELYVYITDPGSSKHPVYVYRLFDDNGTLNAVLHTSFNSYPAGEESIVVDHNLGRVLVADEQGEVYVYSLFGQNLLTRFGSGYFTGDVEGLVIYDCGGDSGYVIISDQIGSATEFEIFSRKKYHHIGTFTGKSPHIPKETDGLALTQYALPNLPNGALWAQSDDQNVHCFDWKSIADSFNLAIVIYDDNSLPVQLKSFTGQIRKSIIYLNWTVSSEFNNLGFELYRKTDTDSNFVLIQSYQTDAALKSKGNSTTPQHYGTIDLIPSSSLSTIWYRLMQVDYSGIRTELKTIQLKISQHQHDSKSSFHPDQYVIYPNFPNPFNSSTIIPVQLARPVKISVSVFDLSGKRIKTLFQGYRQAGIHTFVWDGTDNRGVSVPSGVYVFDLLTNNLHFTRKMLLVR